MNPKHPRSSQRSAPNDVEEAAESQPAGAKALTVNVPLAVLNLAKTRASLEGTTMSAIVTDALTAYAAGLQGVLSQLGLNKPTR
jgi:hypothetical protein